MMIVHLHLNTSGAPLDKRVIRPGGSLAQSARDIATMLGNDSASSQHLAGFVFDPVIDRFANLLDRDGENDN